MALAPIIKKEQTPEEAPIVDDSIVPKEAPIESTTEIQQSIQYYPADFQPCNWSLKPQGGDLISGVNLKTGKHFNGTIAEFNAFIKQNH